MSAWSPEASVRLLKTGSDGSAKPVWVCPVFSGVTACFDSMLASYSGYKRTVYGLQDPYLTGNDDALTASFDEWIAMYIAAIKTKQADGPYTFMGYSQGMHWCWAIAEHLRKRGDKTDDIIMLDPNFPSWNKADRVLVWDGPQAAKGMGAPMCIIRLAFGGVIKGMVKDAQWATAAQREALVQKVIARETAKPDLYEDMLIQMELDAGLEWEERDSN